MNIIFRLIGLFLLCISSFFVRAQNCEGKIFGYVLDSEDKRPLIGASVTISSSGKTDTSGYFMLDKLCPGNYDIHVSNLGFSERHIVFALSANKELSVLLNRTSTTLKSVEVRGARSEPKPLQASSQLSGAALEMTKGESLGEALKAIAGVNAIQPALIYPNQ